MASHNFIVAASLVAAASPLSAANDDRTRLASAPTGTEDTRYCMRIAASTGTLVERTRCWTRAQWADQGVDVDRDWPREGVRTVG